MNLTEKGDYCFSIIANNGMTTVLVQGRFEVSNINSGTIQETKHTLLNICTL